ncbi:MAG: LysR family transcriptional regulator, partial [Betaproteobacteria bacterium]|nr:LysR family transcriptional regulator [Betaproteobacteria bacterium]
MRHATLRQLKVFETVARRLSFSRAAEELHLSQPAVSTQVKQL